MHLPNHAPGPRVEHLWSPLHEPEWDEVYVVAPHTGALYVFPATRFEQPDVQARIGALGLTPETRRSHLDVDVRRDDAIPLPTSGTGVLGRAAHAAVWSTLAVAPRLLGLLPVVRAVAAVALQRNDARPLGEVLNTVKRIEGPEHRPRCLTRALVRFGYALRAGHHHVALVIGSYVPTRRLHAWIAIDGLSVGEDPDEVVLHQPCCLFRVGGSTAHR